MTECKNSGQMCLDEGLLLGVGAGAGAGDLHQYQFWCKRVGTPKLPLALSEVASALTQGLPAAGVCIPEMSLYPNPSLY